MDAFPDLYAGTTAKHQALLYASEDDFVRAMEPFVVEGLEAGHGVLAVASSANLDALRVALGRPREVRFVDARHWYVKPSASLGG